jgi:hypothetical protein
MSAFPGSALTTSRRSEFSRTALNSGTAEAASSRTVRTNAPPNTLSLFRGNLLSEDYEMPVVRKTLELPQYPLLQGPDQLLRPGPRPSSRSRWASSPPSTHSSPSDCDSDQSSPGSRYRSWTEPGAARCRMSASSHRGASPAKMVVGASGATEYHDHGRPARVELPGHARPCVCGNYEGNGAFGECRLDHVKHPVLPGAAKCVVGQDGRHHASRRESSNSPPLLPLSVLWRHKKLEARLKAHREDVGAWGNRGRAGVASPTSHSRAWVQGDLARLAKAGALTRMTTY